MGLQEQTERRPVLPTGWLDYREFIRRVGKLIDPDWTGVEHLALPASQQMAQFAQIDDDEANPAYWRQIQSGIDQVLSSAEPVGADGPACTVCGDASTEINGGRGYCSPHSEQRRRVFSLSQLKNEEIAEAGREILWVEIEARYAPERVMRARWNRVYSVVRDHVFGGKPRPAAWCMGEMHWPAVAEWREHYPGPANFARSCPACPYPPGLPSAKRML